MIHVVVVESHHHALEHIHNALRKQRLLHIKDWAMLHFDAHADLACPGQHISAIACYRPQMLIKPKIEKDDVLSNTFNDTNSDSSSDDVNDEDSDFDDTRSTKNLYELFDSTSSGIAEWILPLVLAGNLHTIRWIRPPNTIPLIPTGCHQYNVGVHIQQHDSVCEASTIGISSFLDLPLNSTVKVDWDCQYYLEDDSYVPTTELYLAQPLHLTVVDGPKSSSNTNSDAIQDTKLVLPTTETNHETIEKNNIYSIDICLDYFSCCNPFLHDIELINIPFATALRDVMIHSKLYQSTFRGSNGSTQTTTDTVLDNYQAQVFIFRQKLATLLDAFRRISSPSHADILEIVSSLYPFYDSHELTEKLIQGLQNAFYDYDTIKGHTNLIDMAIEALPHLTMPHTSLITENDEIDETIAERISYMRQEIIEYSSNKLSLSGTSDYPFIITVARSADDGFTPPCIVDKLQEMVLCEIHSIFCGCNMFDLARVSKSQSALLANEKSPYNQKHINKVCLPCHLHIIHDYSGVLELNNDNGVGQ